MMTDGQQIAQKLTHRVHIVESFGENDNERRENHSRSLEGALKLIGVEVFRYSAAYLKDLKTVFSRIGEEHVPSGTVPVPYIHIFAHGFSDGSGLSLGGGGGITWSELGDCLRILNESTGSLKNGRRSLLVLCMSSCHGLQAVQMPKQNGKCPFYALIAPSSSILWSDSLVAFMTYYHLMIAKDQHGKQAVAAMNVASGQTTPIFQLITWQDLEQ